MVRIARFLLEYIKWNIKGRPIRSDMDMKILYGICENCPNYEPYAPGCTFGTCNVCGCNISREDKTLNKLAWETTKCPKGKW